MKGSKRACPSHVVTLYEYNPFHDEVECDYAQESPDVNKQLSFHRNEILVVKSTVLDYWILCSSSRTGKEGYLCTSYVAPLSEQGELSVKMKNGIDVTDNGHTHDKSLLIPIEDSRLVDMKYFPNAPASKRRMKNPEATANIFSQLTFWWMTNLMVTGFKRPLTESDLWELQSSHRVEKLQQRFEKYWNVEITKKEKSPLTVKHRKKKTKKKSTTESEDTKFLDKQEETDSPVEYRHKYRPSLTKTLVKGFGLPFFLAALLKLIHDSLMFTGPWLLGKVIEFIKRGDEEVKWGYIYAVCLLLVVTGQSVLLQRYFHLASIVAMRIRSAILSTIFKKMLRLSNTGRRDLTAGEMVNLMSVDSQKCFDLLLYLNLIWSGPFQIVVSLVYLYLLMGWSILAGFAVLVFMLPINIFVSSKEKQFQSKKMSHKDSRSKLMNEILNGIKILKLFAWEDSFYSKVQECRNSELKELKKVCYLYANYQFSLSLTPFVVSCATFVLYVFLGNELTAEKAFVAISLFNIMRFPLFILPTIISNIVQYGVSAKRITKFLEGDELDVDSVFRNEFPDTKSKPVVEVKEGTFTWVGNEKPVLKNINISLSKGSLTALVGQVGTGKSSLLSALLGEINKVEGSVHVSGEIAYVSQQPWIQNRSLRDNILFGKKYIKHKYDDVIHACALDSDIEILPNGDLTEIGEKGINLSGGQKQRVALARAVYNNADVYLLDDPLSAVDAHVGKHIFDLVIGENGLLKNKTCVLVTHNLTFLPSVDQIIVIAENTLSEVGSYQELSSSDGDFGDFLKTYMNEQVEEEAISQGGMSSISISPRSNVSGERSNFLTVDRTSATPAMITASTYSLNNLAEGTVSEEGVEITKLLEEHKRLEKLRTPDSGALIQKETTETGRVKRSVFFIYAKSIGLISTVLVLVLAFAAEGFLIGTRFWLAKWSSDFNITEAKRDHYLIVYGGLGIGQGLSIWVENLIFSYAVVKGAKNLHVLILKNVLRCPMSFFETTPIGRIVNRFSKDVNMIDEGVPKNLKSFISCFMTLIGTVLFISLSTPLFLTMLIPIAILYYLTQRFYVSSSRQLKRIESVKRSPIYNHFFESIYGASTIRAFGYTDKFIEENMRRVNEDQAALFPTLAANRWLAMRIELCGNLVTFAAAIFCIVGRNSISAGVAGVSISYALQATQTLNWLVRMTSELETNIVAVERVKEYIDLQNEASWEIPERKPDPKWPQEGKVDVEELCLKYRDDLAPALNNISFSIKSSEKVGIVGRTGAGKSSLTLALFRLVEACGGKILIDGIDIAQIGLKDLRNKLTIIPQDPVLFSGTLRFNLDPFSQFSDSDLWHMLEVAHLKEFVSGLDDKLEYEIMEGGDNLSVGQRQLICLGRALLRKTKILILDEATAAVDMETDAVIQETIRKEFKDCTILTIAHRLNTILDYDRLFVLSKGTVIECDTPGNLLANKTSTFYQMAKDAGLVS